MPGPRRDVTRPPGLFPGVPYDYAAIAEGESLVFTAGACPLDAEGRVVGRGDLEAQARQVLDNLFVTLRAAGAGPEDVLKTTVFVASSDQSDLVRVWDVVAAAFAPARPPSTLLGVAALGYTGQLVEIEAVALTSGSGRKA
jgi:enamine deaminase RidA (YjgF/YER057c/UK114 family)